MNGFGRLNINNVSYEGYWKNDLPSGHFIKEGKYFTLSGIFNDFINVNGQMWIK